MYFWLVFALQEAKLSVKRLRNLLFGSRAQLKGRPASEGEATSSEAPGQAAGEEEAVPGAEVAPRLETTGREAGSGASESEGKPKPPGGHRAGTGRLGAEAYVGAERTECRHEDLAVGQRCPVCGQGTLYELPPGVEIRIDGHGLLSAMRYELQKLRCSACGQIFTASLPTEAGEDKYSPRARAVLAIGRCWRSGGIIWACPFTACKATKRYWGFRLPMRRSGTKSSRWATVVIGCLRCSSAWRRRAS